MEGVGVGEREGDGRDERSTSSRGTGNLELFPPDETRDRDYKEECRDRRLRKGPATKSGKSRVMEEWSPKRTGEIRFIGIEGWGNERTSTKSSDRYIMLVNSSNFFLVYSQIRGDVWLLYLIDPDSSY